MYLTTPIYYVNDVPHLGHAYTTVLADALVRWQRLQGRPARLVTGTDEHGLKVARAAAAAGTTPAALAATTAERFRSAWQRLHIGYDDFVRTTSDRHVSTVTQLLQIVYDRGYVELGTYDGRYCVACEAYVADPVCSIHRRPTEHVTEENYFFRLSAFSDRLGEWLSRPDVVRPATRRNEALGWLRAGLVDFSISRPSLEWGVPLPWDRRHVAYVWFDALGAYLTGAGFPGPDFARWWPAHHLIGKDILRFHAIYWPAILLAAGLPLPAGITVHGFLLARGEKISKSGLRGVPLDDLVDTYGADGLRYHLLRSYPVGPDGDFSVEALTARYNADLANTLGNLLARVSALVSSHCQGVGPAPSLDSPLSGPASSACGTAVGSWDDGQPAEALAAVWRLVAAANSYLVAAQPWRQEAGSPAAARVLGDCLEALRLAAILASPAIPNAAASIWRRLGLVPIDSGRLTLGSAALRPLAADPASVPDARVPDALGWGGYSGGTRVAKGSPLFPRVTRSRAEPD